MFSAVSDAKRVEFKVFQYLRYLPIKSTSNFINRSKVRFVFPRSTNFYSPKRKTTAKWNKIAIIKKRWRILSLRLNVNNAATFLNVRLSLRIMLRINFVKENSVVIIALKVSYSNAILFIILDFIHVKGLSNANIVTKVLNKKAIWKSIWKFTQGKSHSNANIAKNVS